MELKLFFWSGFSLGNQEHLIVAFASDIEKAKAEVLEKVNEPKVREELIKFFNIKQPIEHDQPAAVIIVEGPQIAF